MTRRPFTQHEVATIEGLRRDPAFAAEYINAVLQDGNERELLVALRRLADALGGVASVAEAAGVNKTSLYRALSKSGNPEIKTLRSVLRAMRLGLAVRPLSRPPTSRGRLPAK
jgi:probable addiction module antidote protein